MAVRTEKLAVSLPDGFVAHFEVSSTPSSDGYEDAGFGRLSFDGVVGAIESVAGALATTMKKLAPKSASVELGVELSVEDGKLLAVFVQGQAKANLKITLAWGG